MRTSAWGRGGVGRFARTLTWAVAAAMLLANGEVSQAQEQLNPEQLKKAYDDALVQLKAAQERKNQLAADNEKLGAQVVEMQKQMEKMRGEMEELKRADAEHAERTFVLRSHYAAWREFVRRDPELQGRWRAFFEDGFLLMSRDLPDGVTPPDWPVKPPTAGPTTQPAGDPTTQPVSSPATQPGEGLRGQTSRPSDTSTQPS